APAGLTRAGRAERPRPRAPAPAPAVVATFGFAAAGLLAGPASVPALVSGAVGVVSRVGGSRVAGSAVVGSVVVGTVVRSAVVALAWVPGTGRDPVARVAALGEVEVAHQL